MSTTTHFRVVPFYPATDIEQLSRFPCGGYSDESTIVYMQHPCVILTALEVVVEVKSIIVTCNIPLHLPQVLGYRIVASSSTAVKQDYNEYMWTMRKEFTEIEQSIINEETTPAIVVRDNLTNINREVISNLYNKVDDPE